MTYYDREPSVMGFKVTLGWLEAQQIACFLTISTPMAVQSLV